MLVTTGPTAAQPHVLFADGQSIIPSTSSEAPNRRCGRPELQHWLKRLAGQRLLKLLPAYRPCRNGLSVFTMLTRLAIKIGEEPKWKMIVPLLQRTEIYIYGAGAGTHGVFSFLENSWLPVVRSSADSDS